MTKALISVSNKGGMERFAEQLSDLGVEIIATEGTAREISKNGIPVTHVSEMTGFSEMLGGGIKTLHPMVHAAIATGEITIVVVNLIPLTTVVESMDIGGVALLKSAIKNWKSVAAVTDPGQYGAVIKEIGSSGGVSSETRLKLAEQASVCIVTYETEVCHIIRELMDSVG